MANQALAQLKSGQRDAAAEQVQHTTKAVPPTLRWKS